MVSYAPRPILSEVRCVIIMEGERVRCMEVRRTILRTRVRTQTVLICFGTQ